MELTRLSLLALFCLALVGNVASHLEELNTEEEKHHSSLFFINDLYPGKIMSGLRKLSEAQPFWSIGWLPVGKQNKPSGYSLDDICSSPSGVGEDKYCATSLESMKNFAISKLGENIEKISGSFAKNEDQYTVTEVKKIADKGVMCHRLNFEKVVFYCHQVNATTSYMVPLVASSGTEIKALAACHHDTRGMNLGLLYDVLKVKPGTTPICHFVGNKAIAWIPKTSDLNGHLFVN